MEWIPTYYVRDRWDADFVNMVENDLEFLADYYDVEITPFTANYEDQVHLIRDKLNQLEKNINKLVVSVPFPVRSYGGPVEYYDTLPRRWQLNRWVDILDELSER